LVALLCCSACPLAAEPPSRGFCAGGNVGVTSCDDDGAFDHLNFDESGTRCRIHGSDKFLKYLAVEARLSRPGSHRLGGYGDPQETFDATAIAAHVVGGIPFRKSGRELFGQPGLGSLKVDTNCCGSDSNTVGSAGLGVRFCPTPHVGIAVETDA